MSKICVGWMMFVIFISSTIDLSDSSEDIQRYPPYYAINLGNEDGQRLFLRAQGCTYYIHWGTNAKKTILWIENGVWRIDNDCWENKNEVKGCGEQLFRQNRTAEQPLPTSEGWIDVQNNKTQVTLDMVQIETCTKYKSIGFSGEMFFDFPLTAEAYKEEGCNKYADSKLKIDNQLIEVLLNTKTVEDGSIQCKFQEIYINPGANVKLVNDCENKEAAVTIYDRGCKVNETKSVPNPHCEPDNSDSALLGRALLETPGQEDKDEPLNAASVVGPAAGGAVAVVVAAVAGVVMWRKYRGSGSSDNNTGVDVNEMYGEDEYYQYTESRHQTSVVDENDYYDNDDEEE